MIRGRIFSTAGEPAEEFWRLFELAQDTFLNVLNAGSPDCMSALGLAGGILKSCQ